MRIIFYNFSYMVTLHHSPTVKLTHIFANFKILNDLISSYQKVFSQYEIKMFFPNGRKRKLICNLAAVIEYLSKHDADGILVFGLKQSDKYLLIDKDFDDVTFYKV